jgi:uncharacterized membrane protein
LLLGGIFALIDAVWLKSMNKLYKKELGGLLLDRPKMGAAIIFYLLYILGMMVFVLVPAIGAGEWQKATLHGILFGVVTYATYDLTNLATLKNWSVKVTIVDLLWGGFVTAVTVTVTYFIVAGWFK